MVQYGTKTDHLGYLGDHGPEMILNGFEDDNPSHFKRHPSRVLGFPGFFRRHPPRVGLPGFPLKDALQRVSGNFPICEKWMRKFTQPWRRKSFSSSTNPSEGYMSLNQPLRGVCVLQPTPPRGMCPSTNPSEGYVSINQSLRGACVLQPTPPRGMCPSTNSSEG